MNQKQTRGIKIDVEPGWKGAFTRHHAEGAYPNGTRVVKCNTEPKDGTPDGVPGVVLGSFPKIPRDGLVGQVSADILVRFPDEGLFCYYIEWADKPRVAVMVMEYKVRKAA